MKVQRTVAYITTPLHSAACTGGSPYCCSDHQREATQAYSSSLLASMQAQMQPPTMSPHPYNNSGSPSIFVDSQGSSLRVFVETSEVPNRPKIVGALRAGGGRISHSPSDAQIILIDPSSSGGAAFVRDWAGSGGRVVLDYAWVRRSKDAGKPLLANENWGGCQVSLGDLPMQDGEMDDDNPLPTPRLTPARISESAKGRQSDPSSFQTPQQQPFPAGPQPVPISDTFGNAMNSPQLNPPQLNLLGASPAMPLTPQAIQQLLLSQQLLTQQNQTTNQLNPMGLVQTLMDMMRFQAQQSSASSPWPGQLGFNGVQNNGMQLAYAPYQPMDMSTPLHSSMGQRVDSPHVEDRRGSLRSRNASESREDSPYHRSLPPSLARSVSGPHRSPATNPFTSGSASSSKGKRKLREDSIPSDDMSPTLGSSSNSPSSPSRRKIVERRIQGQLFKRDSGEPLLFHVQVDIRNRQELVQSIKKNGGQITSDVTIADYDILNARSKTVQVLYDQVVANDKMPLHPSYVLDCVDEGAILDTEPYVIEDPHPTRKRGRPSKSHKASPSKIALKKKAQAKAKTKSETKLRKPKKSESASPMLFSPPIVNGSAPSPPPPTGPPQPYVDGRNLYTNEERDYFFRYVRILIQRDPEISMTAIGKKMAEKMPAHSNRSWEQFGFKYKDELGRIRKKAAIAQRKVAAAPSGPPSTPSEGSSNWQTPTQGEETDEDGPPDAKRRRQDKASGGRDVDTDEQDDLQVITDYFATIDHEESSDEIFAKLDSLRRCVSASSWLEFYEAHHKEIAQGVSARVAEDERRLNENEANDTVVPKQEIDEYDAMAS